MTRETIEELISRHLDGELDEEARRHLEMAMEADPELRELARDLKRLKLLATEPAPPCPASVEVRLAQRVKEVFGSKGGFALGSIPHWAMAATVLIALGLGFYFGSGLFLGDDEGTIGRTASLPDRYRQKFEAVHLAQANYHKAIREMEDLALKRLEELPPEIAHEFARNLRTINQAIAACERLSDEHPDSHMTYTSLARAYRAKVDLLETILEA